MAAHRAEPRPRLANLAAHQVQVDYLADGVDRVLVLGDPHSPAADHAVALGKDPGRLADGVPAKPGLGLYLGPVGGAHLLKVLIKVRGMLLDEGEIDASALLLQDVLGHAAHRRHVTAQLGGQVLVADAGGRRGQQLGRALGAGEALQRHLFEVVEGDNLAALARRLAQGVHHARVVGTRVLAEHEDRLGDVEVLQHHSALAHPDRLDKADAARLVAHVGAVREVVGAIETAEQLIEVGCLIASAPRGIELHLVRARQALELVRDEGKGLVPAYRLVVIAGRVVAQRLRQTALIFEPVVALAGEAAHRMLGKERGPHRLAGRLPGHRLGAVLAELEGPLLVVTPGTARAIEAIGLVDPQQVLDVLAGLLAAQHLLEGGLQRRKSTGLGWFLNMTGHWVLRSGLRAGHGNSRPGRQTWAHE
ncbi:hypothetical protein D3C71_673790 [compost metagenome]